MAFLYYPSKFEKIIEDTLKDINGGLYKTKEERRLRMEMPSFDDSGLIVLSECTFKKDPKEETEQNNEFATYFRNIDTEKVYVVGKDDEKIPDCLITKLVNDPKLYYEQFMIGDDATRLNVLNKNNKKIFIVELLDPLEGLMPSEIRGLDRVEKPLKGNEEYIKNIIKTIMKTAVDYAIKDGETYIMH